MEEHLIPMLADIIRLIVMFKGDLWTLNMLSCLKYVSSADKILPKIVTFSVSISQLFENLQP